MGQDAAVRSSQKLVARDDLAPLFDLIAVCHDRDCAATTAMLDTLPSLVSAFAVSAGWFAPAGLLTEWTCHACDEPHKADIERGRDGSYTYLCLHNGRLSLTRSQLQTYSPSLEAVLATLAVSIGGNGRHVSCYAADHLYKIGYVDEQTQERSWTLGFATALGNPDALVSLMQVLRTSFPKGPGLIATIGQRPADAIRFDGYLFADATALFRLQKDKVVFKQIEASRLLFGTRAATSTAGAKSRSSNIAEIREGLIQAGVWPDLRSAQIRLIRARWLTKTMGKKPAPTSLPRNLREIEKSERERGQSAKTANVQNGKTIVR